MSLVWLDATFHKVREAGRVISVATVVAIGVRARGNARCSVRRPGPSEDHQFWTSFLRSLVKRGLKGVRLVISDAHEGLRQAIEKILHEGTWQGCRVALHAEPALGGAQGGPGCRGGDRADGVLSTRHSRG